MDVKKLKNINDYFTVRELESMLTYSKGAIILYNSYDGDYKREIKYHENKAKELKEKLKKYYK